MHVYIIYSKSLEKYYVGHTNDLERRLAEHNYGQSTFTRPGKPWRLIFSVECESRQKAVRFELKIKKRGIGRYLNDNQIIH